MILRSLQLLDKPLATCIAAPISGEQNDRIGPYVKDAVSHSQLNDFIHGDFIPGVAAAFLFYYIYTQIIETLPKRIIIRRNGTPNKRVINLAIVASTI